MSGHSKWATIKHQKGAKDARRGKLFAKLIRGIEVAARTGGASPEGNPTLADAIQKAKDNSVAYLFNRKGQVVIPAEGVDEDRVMEVALEAGAEDVESGEDGFVVTTAPGDLREVRAAFERAGIAYQSAEVTMVPTVSVPLDREGAVKVLRLLDAIEDLDDTQDVYANLDIPAEVMAELA